MQIHSLFGKAYDRAEQYDESKAKSLLFNSFIFMQVVNEVNSRKIRDEYNVFEGMFKSPIFFGVLATTTLLQVIIMQTPVSKIFKIIPINGIEWAVSIGFGLFSLPLSFATRFISRACFGCNRPEAGVDVAEMDLGYGTKLVAPPDSPPQKSAIPAGH